jgi:hypothetical protein
VPDNIVLISLPPYTPELNSMENVWEYLRGNKLSALVWKDYDAILEACRVAWNFLINDPDRIRSIGHREWATVSVQAVGITRCPKIRDPLNLRWPGSSRSSLVARSRTSSNDMQGSIEVRMQISPCSMPSAAVISRAIPSLPSVLAARERIGRPVGGQRFQRVAQLTC